MALTYDVTLLEGRWTPLHWACRAGRAGFVESLIARNFSGTSVAVPDMQGEWTPLAIAVFYGHSGMLQKLSAMSQVALGFEGDIACSKGQQYGGAWCNACFYVSPSV